MSESPRWLPLESNPDVMTKFLVNMGLSEDWAVVDVFSFDPEMLAFLPQPVAALILLYPCKDADQTEAGDPSLGQKLYYMKQTIHNACGTIALLHAVGNSLDKVKLQDGSLLKQFFDRTVDLTPEEKGKQLETNTDIMNTHESHANEGQTAAPTLADEVDHHFIAFVERGGRLYQLDGNKKGPIDLGSSNQETFLNDAAQVCQKIAASNPDAMFTAVALAKTE